MYTCIMCDMFCILYNKITKRGLTSSQFAEIIEFVGNF